MIGQQVTQDHVLASDIRASYECSHVFLGAGPRYEEASPKTANLQATQMLHDDILNNSSDYMFSSKYTPARMLVQAVHMSHMRLTSAEERYGEAMRKLTSRHS